LQGGETMAITDTIQRRAPGDSGSTCSASEDVAPRWLLRCSCLPSVRWVGWLPEMPISDGLLPERLSHRLDR